MIAAIINWSLNNRFLILLLTAILVVGGIQAIRSTPIDALPDLSDVQVIIKTSYPGQAPQVVEDQVTYPLTTALLAVPGAVNVRGYSFFGDSYVYIIFEDGTDLYWARSRVLEYLNQVSGKLPPAAKPALGPDATGVGWIYEYALVDRSGVHDRRSAFLPWFAAAVTSTACVRAHPICPVRWPSLALSKSPAGTSRARWADWRIFAIGSRLKWSASWTTVR